MVFIFALVCLFLLYRFFFGGYDDEKVVSVYFGLPGAGKSTFAASLANRCFGESRIVRLLRRHSGRFPVFQCWLDAGRVWIFPLRQSVPVYSNVPIIGAYKLTAKEDVGVYDIRDGKLIIDEAGIEYNNRNYKSMKQETIEWFKLHRHYRMSVDVFSQSFEDMDITLRRLAYRYYLVQKSLIPGFIVLRRIHRKIGIDPITHQFCDFYSWAFLGLGNRRIYAPKYYKYFDSYSAPELLKRPWERYQRLDDEVVDVPAAVPEKVGLRDRVRLLCCSLRMRFGAAVPDRGCEPDGDLESIIEGISPEDLKPSGEMKMWGFEKPLEGGEPSRSGAPPAAAQALDAD